MVGRMSDSCGDWSGSGCLMRRQSRNLGGGLHPRKSPGAVHFHLRERPDPRVASGPQAEAHWGGPCLLDEVSLLTERISRSTGGSLRAGLCQARACGQSPGRGQ